MNEFNPKNISLDNRSVDGSEPNSSHNIGTNSSNSKTLISSNVKNDPSAQKSIPEKRQSKLEEPYRNSDKLKKNIERLNETLFKRTMIKKENVETKADENLTKQEMNKKIIEKVLSNKKKLKSEHLSRDTKMQKKLKDFKKMETFFDIQGFLKEINILEDSEFKEFLTNLKANMKEIRIKKPLATEKNALFEKIQPSLIHARRKIDDFYSQNPQRQELNDLYYHILNYLIEDSEKNKRLEQTELEMETNNLKDKLLNLQVIAKGNDEIKRIANFSGDNAFSPEEFQELEDIKEMLSKLGINLDDKTNDIFGSKFTDAYFKTYKYSADKMRVYMDRIIKSAYRRKWIESHSRKNNNEKMLKDQNDGKNHDAMDLQMKNSEIISMSNINQDHHEKNSPFITNFAENKDEKSTSIAKSSLNRSSLFLKSLSRNSSESLQSKVKRKLENLMNTKRIFPLLSNKNPDDLIKPQPVKVNRSMTYSNLIHNKKQNVIASNIMNKRNSGSMHSSDQSLLKSVLTREKAKTLHVNFGEDKVRHSIIEFNKISNDALKEHRKSLRKSRKSVYLPTPFVNPEIKLDLNNIKRFDDMMNSINERNHMVYKFQKFLNYVEKTDDENEKKRENYHKGVQNVEDDMDILQEKMEVPPIESIRDDVYTNEYIENRNQWYKRRINKNLKNTIRLVLSQNHSNKGQNIKEKNPEDSLQKSYNQLKSFQKIISKEFQ